MCLFNAEKFNNVFEAISSSQRSNNARFVMKQMCVEMSARVRVDFHPNGFSEFKIAQF
jgi:hypothetical protein